MTDENLNGLPWASRGVASAKPYRGRVKFLKDKMRGNLATEWKRVEGGGDHFAFGALQTIFMLFILTSYSPPFSKRQDMFRMPLLSETQYSANPQRNTL